MVRGRAETLKIMRPRRGGGASTGLGAMSTLCRCEADRVGASAGAQRRCEWEDAGLGAQRGVSSSSRRCGAEGAGSGAQRLRVGANTLVTPTLKRGRWLSGNAGQCSRAVGAADVDAFARRRGRGCGRGWTAMRRGRLVMRGTAVVAIAASRGGGYRCGEPRDVAFAQLQCGGRQCGCVAPHVASRPPRAPARMAAIGVAARGRRGGGQSRCGASSASSCCEASFARAAAFLVAPRFAVLDVGPGAAFFAAAGAAAAMAGIAMFDLRFLYLVDVDDTSANPEMEKLKYLPPRQCGESEFLRSRGGKLGQTDQFINVVLGES